MLTPRQRRALVDAPFASLGVVRHSTSYPHAGTLIARETNFRDDEQDFRARIERGESLNSYAFDEVSALWGD